MAVIAANTLRVVKMIRKISKGFLNLVPQISGVPGLYRKTLCRGNLAIFCYHLVIDRPLPFSNWIALDLASFKRQMAYLKKHFILLDLQEGVEKCLHNRLDRPTAVITFDDGFYNIFSNAFPVLRQLDIPATVFLSTRFIDTGHAPWFSHLDDALAKTSLSKVNWRNKRFDIGSAERKHRTSIQLQAQLKLLPHQRLMDELKGIVLDLGGDPECSFDKNSPYRMLDTDAISQMIKSDLVSFGGHTHSHAILSLLTQQEQEEQIILSLEKVKELTGTQCHIFSYPNGGKEDYTQHTIDILNQHGVNLAVTTRGGYNRPSAEPMTLRRISIGGNWGMGLFQFAVQTGFTW